MTTNSKPAYLGKVIALARGLGPGVHTVHVYHDQDCAIWRGGACDCRPAVRSGKLKQRET